MKTVPISFGDQIMCTFCIFFHVRPVVVISNPSNDDSAVAECLWLLPLLPTNKNNLIWQRRSKPSISLLEQATVSKYYYLLTQGVILSQQIAVFQLARELCSFLQSNRIPQKLAILRWNNLRHVCLFHYMASIFDQMEIGTEDALSWGKGKWSDGPGSWFCIVLWHLCYTCDGQLLQILLTLCFVQSCATHVTSKMDIYYTHSWRLVSSHSCYVCDGHCLCHRRVTHSHVVCVPCLCVTPLWHVTHSQNMSYRANMSHKKLHLIIASRTVACNM